MKKAFTLLFAMAFLSFTYAQNIPNNEFESWTGGKPTSWDCANVTGIVTTVAEETAAPHSGSKSVKIETKTSLVGTIPGFITLGVFDLASQSISGGIPFPHRPSKIKGYFKYAPASGDQMFIGAGLSKTVGGVRDTIGQALLLSPTAQTTWAPFEVDITWSSSDTPDSLNIIISSSNLTGGSGVVGSILRIDSLYFEFLPVGGAENGKVPFTVSNCYPNPASDISNINFVAPESSVYNFKIINLIGVEVYNARIDANAGLNFYSFPTSGLASGIYMVNLSNNNYNITKSLVVK